MGMFNCFCSSWKKKDMGVISPIPLSEDNKTLHIKVEHLKNHSETAEKKTSSFSVPVPFSVPGSSMCEVKVINHNSPIATGAGDVDYEGGDEHDQILSMKREDSDFDLQAHVGNSNEETYGTNDIFCSLVMNNDYMNDSVQNDDTEEGVEMCKNGHASDPGTRKEEFWPSPKLKRSCSDLVMRSTYQELVDELPHSEELGRLTERYRDEVFVTDAMSPVSVMTHRSADKVILKKHSSSQILPSRSRKLWWKLFLWSHRNLHRSGPLKPQLAANNPDFNQQGGYCSDTVEPRQAVESGKLGSPCSFSGELVDTGNCNGFYGVSGMWPQNQWVALPAESSPFARVDEWVKEVAEQPSFQTDSNDHTGHHIVFPPSPENSTSLARGFLHSTQFTATKVPEEISQANSVIQSLNASSTVAHITGIGLKVIPSISHFSSLRSVNLSGNFIVHIAPGSLPKGLHVLDLSRSKVSTIEGLRELTRLRVLDLSYNRISRVGQGLSSCVLIKELYLSGNKISNVEGLHRLLKLTVLDLSFNKITTTKAFGQLVANYNSLKALNLLGNPIQSNISDDQLRKMVCSLLPKVAFLNKQPVNTQKAREMGADAIAKAALGSSSRSTRRKSAKSVHQGSSSSANLRRSSGGAAQKNRQRARSHTHHHPAGKHKMH